MTTYSQLLYHLVFSTKHRKFTLTKPNRERLFRIIWNLLEKKSCHPYAVNGTGNHIHIAVHIKPEMIISSLVKDIKLGTSKIIKNESLFPSFEGWQEGYGIFSLSMNEKHNLVNYILNQEKHHEKMNFESEFRQFLREFEIAFKEEYLFT